MDLPCHIHTKVDEEGNLMESAPHPQQKLQVRLSGQAEIYDILRRKEEGAS